MTDLSREAKALLELASDEDSPTAEDRARVRRALAAGLAASVASSASPAAAAAGKSALAAGASSFATKTAAVWLVVGAVAGLAGTVTMFAMPGHDTHDGASSSKTAPVTRQDPTNHAATSAPAPAAKTTPLVEAETKNAADPPVAVPVPPPKTIVTRSQARTVDTTHTTAVVDAPPTAMDPAPSSVATMSDLPPQSAAPTPPPSSLGAETTLLESARAALGRGDARGALSLLDAHEHRFPNGALTEERLAAKVFALCGLGRKTEAATVAARLLQLSPSSPLRARVLDSCAYLP